MLAKLWKKVLLAVCILACIFNIMSKLVNRNSLEVNLKSANDGNTVFDFTRKEKDESSGPGFIEELQQVLNEEQNKSDKQNVVSQEVVPENQGNENNIQNEVENNNVINAQVSGEKDKDSSEKNNSSELQYKDAFTTFVELF